MRSVLLLPERSEDKTKVIWKWSLLFTVLKLISICFVNSSFFSLQQRLLLAVLKYCADRIRAWELSCKSTYRLWYYKKIKYSKINKNHGKCRGFLFPSFSDYFVRAKPHIMKSTK